MTVRFFDAARWTAELRGRQMEISQAEFSHQGWLRVSLPTASVYMCLVVAQIIASGLHSRRTEVRTGRAGIRSVLASFRPDLPSLSMLAVTLFMSLPSVWTARCTERIRL